MSFSESSVGLQGIAETPIEEFAHASADELLPKTGTYLGLDISKTSTGIALWKNGELLWGTETLTSESGVFSEVLLRRQLKEKLMENLEGEKIDVAAVEDVFSGGNPKTVRLLMQLNTALDELILDGALEVGEFHRIDNKEWKAMLRRLLDPHKTVRKSNDKDAVEALLMPLGIHRETDKGGQDKLDAVGIMLGGMIMSEVIGEKVLTSYRNVSRKIKITEVKGYYDYSLERLLDKLPVGVTHVEFSDRVTERNIVAAVTENPEVIWFTPKLVNIGNIYKKFGVEPYPFGGYLAFHSKTLTGR